MAIFRCKGCAFETTDDGLASNHEVLVRGHVIAASNSPPAVPSNIPAGVKYDSTKERFSLLPLPSLQAIIDVLEYGTRKYSVDNWQRVENPRDRYFDAFMRHVIAWREGEANDVDSGKSHLAHASCCLLFLIWFDQQKVFAPSKRPLVDDIDDIRATDICRDSVDLTPPTVEMTKPNVPAIIAEVENERELRRMKRLKEIADELDQQAAQKPQRVVDSHQNSAYIIPKGDRGDSNGK